jgi:hypothetical protein
MTEQMPIAFMHVLNRYYPVVYQSCVSKIGGVPKNDADCRMIMNICRMYHPGYHDITIDCVKSYSTEDLVGIYRDILI